jgi:hypothetical protein
MELGLQIVRRLMKERHASVVDDDVTSNSGVVNLRVETASPPSGS